MNCASSLTCVLLILCASPSQAQQRPAASSLSIAVDPVTGALRAPTPEELRQLHAAVPSAEAGSALPQSPREAVATLRTLADGTEVMQVPLSAMSELHATVEADGTLSLHHAEPTAAETTGHEQ